MDIKAPIFTLSFGQGADKEFLRKLSLKNYAFSRHIYEAADASLQLQQFYKQISSPLMSNVTFKYEDAVSEITRVNFPIYFRGGNLVICGRYQGNTTIISIISVIYSIITNFIGSKSFYRRRFETS